MSAKEDLATHRRSRSLKERSSDRSYLYRRSESLSRIAWDGYSVYDVLKSKFGASIPDLSGLSGYWSRPASEEASSKVSYSRGIDLWPNSQRRRSVEGQLHSNEPE